MKKKNLIGQKFGRLSILKDSGERLGGNVVWLCRCDCKRVVKVRSYCLISKHTKSCGCLVKENATKMSRANIKHGDASTNNEASLYRIWRSMKKRCYLKSFDSYKYYGARGIEVCDEWKNNYNAFKLWAILNGYGDNLTIDRINPRGNYEPSNCQWLTNSENAKKAWEDRK